MSEPKTDKRTVLKRIREAIANVDREIAGNAPGRRSMGAYHYNHSSAPNWCPAAGASLRSAT